MSGGTTAPRPRQPLKEYASYGMAIGLFIGTPAAVVWAVWSRDWVWAFVGLPASVALFLVVGAFARTPWASWLGRVARRTGVRSVAAVFGLLVGAAGGAALIWFGIWSNLNSDTCDPEQVRCTLVINGVARGGSTESVGSQRFSNFLLSLAMIGPGVVLLVGVARGAVSFARWVRSTAA